MTLGIHPKQPITQSFIYSSSQYWKIIMLLQNIKRAWWLLGAYFLLGEIRWIDELFSSDEVQRVMCEPGRHHYNEWLIQTVNYWGGRDIINQTMLFTSAVILLLDYASCNPPPPQTPPSPLAQYGASTEASTEAHQWCRDSRPFLSSIMSHSISMQHGAWSLIVKIFLITVH